MTYLIQQEVTDDICQSVSGQWQPGSTSSFQAQDCCYLACSSGEHKAYCFIDANDKSEAEKMCLTGAGSNCEVIEVEQHSSDKLRSLHSYGSELGSE